jgi:hypothetical protein
MALIHMNETENPCYCSNSFYQCPIQIAETDGDMKLDG